MAFLIHSVRDSEVPAWEYLPADDGTYKVGQALVFSSGRLVPVSSGVGQDTDEGKHYVSMCDRVVATDGDVIPVVEAAVDDIIWEVPLQAASADLAIGASYTIHTDGLQLTSTTTKGCFTVLDFDGKAAGDRVRGRLL